MLTLNLENRMDRMDRAGMLIQRLTSGVYATNTGRARCIRSGSGSSSRSGRADPIVCSSSSQQQSCVNSVQSNRRSSQPSKQRSATDRQTTRNESKAIRTTRSPVGQPNPLLCAPCFPLPRLAARTVAVGILEDAPMSNPALPPTPPNHWPTPTPTHTFPNRSKSTPSISNTPGAAVGSRSTLASCPCRPRERWDDGRRLP